MRANAIKREPELQAFWDDSKIYETLSQENSGDVFVLHDGPPYANGNLHMGHALNKVLKDIINKYQLLRDRKVRYVPGWDCHGLPIELKVLQTIDRKERANLTPLELRQKAKEFALETVENQAKGFRRFGVWGNWDKPYLTLQPEYEAAQLDVFGQMVLKGYIYRGLKSVHWSPSSQTALAEAELEYPEGHTSPSIYVGFPMVSASDTAKATLAPYLDNLGVAIWTTTPWTIPANVAVAVNADLTYTVVEVASGAPFKNLIVGKDLIDTLAGVFGSELTAKVDINGADLAGSTYSHPLAQKEDTFNRESPIVIGGDYITTESGTGLVHTAPGHGMED
ncbi:MAG: class I tRNA ligase family protein, partial [Cyanobacteria bacterium J06628_4]